MAGHTTRSSARLTGGDDARSGGAVAQLESYKPQIWPGSFELRSLGELLVLTTLGPKVTTALFGALAQFSIPPPSTLAVSLCSVVVPLRWTVPAKLKIPPPSPSYVVVPG